MSVYDNVTFCPVSQSYKRILLPLTYSLVFVLGLTLNGVLLGLMYSRTRTCSFIYLANLAVADLLYVLALPLLIVSYALGDIWPFGDVLCKAVRFFFYLNLHGSVMFLTCICVHRFLGVCYPVAALRYRTRRVAVMMSGLIWVLVMLEILPTLIFAHSGFINNRTVCYDLDQYHIFFPYVMTITVVGFLLPFLVILTCYCTMMRMLYQSGKNNSHMGKEMRKNAVRTILAVCLMFVLCFVPYHVARTTYLFLQVYMSKNCTVLYAATICYEIGKPLISLNCCANPLLYFLGSARHRKKLWAQLFIRQKIHPTVCR
ncbi:hypothetical protein DPEC_G00241520 [Dallia pectoralis]|uniref:Uncharacterized protein n=1 Tax=Dallia pectoralis TaxID=75939 RepID=A0ACC2FUS5_DALPE|nr:hypothetical protein DPEC_G00241520 [Dallia pectoralis]